MSRICRYGRFGKAPDPRSRTCLEDAARHNLLPHLYPARLRSLREILQQKTSNEERKTGKRVQNTPATGGIDRGESYHFRTLARETGAEKRENGNYAGKKNQKQNAEALGSLAEESKPREQHPKRSQKRTRTRYVRNPTRARGMDIVPHPAGATSKPGGELPGKSPQELNQSYRGDKSYAIDF